MMAQAHKRKIVLTTIASILIKVGDLPELFREVTAEMKTENASAGAIG